MSLFQLLSLLITAAAMLSLINYRLLRLPPTVGITLLSLGLSLAVLLIGAGTGARGWATNVIGSIDFNKVVLHGILSFLLFAGSLHLDMADLTRQRIPILLLSVAGTVISTGLVGGLSWLIFGLVGFHVPIFSCLQFGALISPTDPIAVLAIMRRAGASRALETQLAGESLFNDGVGAVLFITLLEASAGGRLPTVPAILKLLTLEAGGGILLGVLAGWIAYVLLSLVKDDYQLEILLTLAVAMGGYALADALHISAPLEAVAAGIFVGSRGRAFAVSPSSLESLDRFWKFVDEVLNAVLFLLLGMELLDMRFSVRMLAAGALAIPAILIVRGISVSALLLPLRRWFPLEQGALSILTWGGLRGGLALALALALPPGSHRSLLLAVTYIVVVFSILVQGLSIKRLIRHVGVLV